MKDYQFTSAHGLLECCRSKKISISEAMLRREAVVLGNSADHCQLRMSKAYKIMKEAVATALESPPETMGGLIGGEAIRLNNQRLAGKNLCGNVVSKAISYAMGVLEVNASMGLIVAAPTAGSSGVLPGVLIALQEEHGFADDKMLDALFNAAAVGYLIAHNATIAGAEGGCQAEVGAASAMAASAAVQLFGGTPEQCLSAAASALANLLGLVCDPIGGLVEAPCQKRNAIGASNALICAEITLSGTPSIIPLDEMIAAMYSVGRALPRELRETALGGIAAQPSACSLCSSFNSCKK